MKSSEISPGTDEILRDRPCIGGEPILEEYIVNQKAFQDQYPDELSHCYGCGRPNKHGRHITEVTGIGMKRLPSFIQCLTILPFPGMSMAN